MPVAPLLLNGSDIFLLVWRGHSKLDASVVGRLYVYALTIGKRLTVKAPSIHKKGSLTRVCNLFAGERIIRWPAVSRVMVR